ncbi:peroxidase P7-like [Tasmannia lanceolata]|uniref:peroxidase P7-like n=1 Tax=Tasmannia lanceolata TaxID=3420 RepID=UPI00406324DA
MAGFTHSNLYLGFLIILITISSPVSAQLSVSFYANTCPSVFDTVRAAVRSVIDREPRMGASLMRMLFHDCFVSGCDGGILLEDFGSFVGEQKLPANFNSIRGYEVIDNIKTQVDRACGGSVVSCADILVIAARDSVVQLGGPSYSVPVGRRDARSANTNAANNELVAPTENLDSILQKFRNKGFSPRETVALSGSHTVGQARCTSFRNRIYHDANIDTSFATSLKANCPQDVGNGDNNLAPLDPQSPNRFGNNYYQALINKRALLHSDQELFNGNSTDSIVTMYGDNPSAFSTDFANAMLKMSNLSPLTGTQGEVRVNCKRINLS